MASDKELRHMAKERVEFKEHLFIYLAVNALLIAINLLTSPNALWFYWVTIFWGFGVLMHGLSVYCMGGKHSEGVRVEKEYQKLKAKNT